MPTTSKLTPPLALRIIPSGLRERVAANLPTTLAIELTLGSKWYDHNKYHKFPIGQKIDCKGPQYFGYGLNPQGWTVVGYTDGGNYEIDTAQGERQVHFKWNIENHFKIADPKAKPFNPDRFKSPSLVGNLD